MWSLWCPWVTSTVLWCQCVPSHVRFSWSPCVTQIMCSLWRPCVDLWESLESLKSPRHDIGALGADLGAMLSIFGSTWDHVAPFGADLGLVAPTWAPCKVSWCRFEGYEDSWQRMFTKLYYLHAFGTQNEKGQSRWLTRCFWGGRGCLLIRNRMGGGLENSCTQASFSSLRLFFVKMFFPCRLFSSSFWANIFP